MVVLLAMAILRNERVAGAAFAFWRAAEAVW